jgi:hypothetical protein
VLEKKLAALEAVGQFLANGLFDDARASEADEGAGFGNIKIAEHGEAGSNAAGGGIGEDADVGQARFIELHEGGRELGELHEADGAFLHARAARCGNDDERGFLFQGAFDRAGNFLADDGAHAATDEFQLQSTDLNRAAVESAAGADNRIGQLGGALHFEKALGIGLGIDEA